MSKLIRWGHRKLAGFSLLELMVVVAILGVLATVAVPRFNIFRARARQSEAKSNMGVIYTLQEAFQIDHEKYYNGEGTTGATWGGSDMYDDATADGYRSGSGDCKPNKLGFRLANCDKARYRYWIDQTSSERTFLSIAFAPSDADARIFPGCGGNATDGGIDRTIARLPTATVAGTSPCLLDGTTANTNMVVPGEGDAWCMDHGRNLHNYWDIVEGCDG